MLRPCLYCKDPNVTKYSEWFCSEVCEVGYKVQMKLKKKRENEKQSNGKRLLQFTDQLLSVMRA